MAYEEKLQSINCLASADLSASQYRFMTINSDGKVARTGDGLKTDGILQDKPDADGRAGALGIGGVSKLVVGGAVTAGDDVASDSAGRGVTATTGDVIGARALTSASTAGQIISVIVKPQSEPLS